jgi:hypothetical protein
MIVAGLISPRRDYAVTCMDLHHVLNKRPRHRTRSTNASANEPRQVPAITLTRSQLTYRDVPCGHIIGPRNKPCWSERLMASAALTGRTIIELFLPGVSWDLEESLV